MAQALTVTVEKNPFLDQNIPYTLILDWTSASDGSVSLPIASTYATAEKAKRFCAPQPTKLTGLLRSCETIPGANGDKSTNKPSSYTISILDSYGYDLLAGTGTTRSATVAERLLPTTHVLADTELTFTIASAGDSKQGRAILEFEDMGYGKL